MSHKAECARSISRTAPVFILTSLSIFVRHDIPNRSYEELATESRFACVAKFEAKGKVIGTGVLVHNRWILTDAHILQGMQPADLAISFGDATVKASQFVVHPDYHGPKYTNGENALVRKGIDLAMVRLTEAFTEVKPALLATEDVPIGTTVNICGYGGAGTADNLQPQWPAGVKRAGTNIIDARGLGEGDSRVPDWYDIIDMDSAAGDRNATGAAEPAALEAIGTGGDSGGGVFALSDGQWRLVGLIATARYDTSGDTLQAYGTLNFLTRITQVREWITTTCSAADDER